MTSLMDEILPLLKRLELFDADWYQAHYTDVRESDLDAWRHFQHYGLQEGRQPGPRFSPEVYLDANPDVRQAGMNPLVHYLRSGHREGRPLTPAEKKRKAVYGSSWPESPLPVNLPKWFGELPAKGTDSPLRVLYVLSVQSGGTPQTNADLMQSLLDWDEAAVECFVLRCNSVHMVLYLFVDGVYVPLRQYKLVTELTPFPHRSDDYDAVVHRWMAEFDIHLVHVRHSAWQGLGIIEQANELDLPVVYSFHDYYTICPSVKLLDDGGRFCGGRCSTSREECHQELWRNDQIYPLKFHSVYKWQRQFAGPLALCSALVTTADRVKDRVLDIFPALKAMPFRIIQHGRDFPEMQQLAEPPERGQNLRVLLPGHLSVAKGAEVLYELAGMQALAHVEWHVLGTLPPEWQARMPGSVIVHGQYQRQDFHHHVARIRPHAGAVLSIWPETWCHTLTELWSAGIPVLGFDIGAVGERIRATGAGWAIEPVEAEAVKAILLSDVPKAWHAVQDNVTQWQKNGNKSSKSMAAEYWQLYREVTRSASE